MEQRFESPVGGDPRKAKVRVRRRRILRSTAALPALCTLLNGVSGFASIYYATKGAAGNRIDDLRTAGWLIFVAMIFDMLDGRLARMTRRTSDFGGQLDSLCDVISFGVAPAMLMMQAMIAGMGDPIYGQAHDQMHFKAFVPYWPVLVRVLWGVAAIYLSCAIVRLARFNVENVPDESSHMDFRGLPSPGAAAAVAALVLLLTDLAHYAAGGDNSDWKHVWLSGGWLTVSLGVILPLATLAAAFLMVSRFRYPHVINQYLRGKRPLSFLLKIIIIIIACLVELPITMAVMACLYAVSGPISWARRSMKAKPVE
jgi:CDP-diacylglycerol--serine O-phosphatidyltransferase